MKNRFPLRRRSKKPRSVLLQRAQDAFNAYIRARDRLLACVSCGRRAPTQCGHYLTVGAHPELRFCELNAHGQCQICNEGYSEGGPSIRERYRAGLIPRIGIDNVLWLEGPHEPKYYRGHDLKQIIEEYRGKRILWEERALRASPSGHVTGPARSMEGGVSSASSAGSMGGRSMPGQPRVEK